MSDIFCKFDYLSPSIKDFSVIEREHFFGQITFEQNFNSIPQIFLLSLWDGVTTPWISLVFFLTMHPFTAENFKWSEHLIPLDKSSRLFREISCSSWRQSRIKLLVHWDILWGVDLLVETLLHQSAPRITSRTQTFFVWDWCWWLWFWRTYSFGQCWSVGLHVSTFILWK